MLKAHQHGQEQFPGVNLVMIGVLWCVRHISEPRPALMLTLLLCGMMMTPRRTPFILVYLFDPMIWFAVGQAIVGAMVGMADKLGSIRDFPSLIDTFPDYAAEFDKKMVGNKGPDRLEHR